MTKLTILGVLAIIYLGVVRLAYFVMSLFIIVICGLTTYELIRNVNKSASRQQAA